MRILSLTILLIICFQTAVISQYTSTPIQIGDILPDVKFSNILNYGKPSLKISDLRGKKVIIDFWSKWCTSCIASFPKTESLQKQFSDSVVILTVTESSMEEFFKLKRNSRILQQSRLPFILEDTLLFKLVSPPSVPFAIWIDEKGTLIAASKGTSLTENNIRKFISGVSLNYNYRNSDFDTANQITISDFSKVKLNDSIKYHSTLKKEKKLEYRPSTKFLRNPLEGVGIQFTDCSILSLLSFAYSFSNQRNIITNDERLKYIQLPLKKEYREQWAHLTTYSYLLQMEPQKHYSNGEILLSCIRKDLLEHLGIKGIKRKIETEVLILRKSSSSKFDIKFSSGNETPIIEQTQHGIFMQQKKISHLTEKIEFRINENNDLSSYIHVFNETGINEEIDIDLIFKDNSIKSINEALIEKGLELIKSYRTLEYLFLERE